MINVPLGVCLLTAKRLEYCNTPSTEYASDLGVRSSTWSEAIPLPQHSFSDGNHLNSAQLHILFSSIPAVPQRTMKRDSQIRMVSFRGVFAFSEQRNAHDGSYVLSRRYANLFYWIRNLAKIIFLVHSARRPFIGLLYLPRVIVSWRIWWNKWQGKPKYSEKTCPGAT
jgi:hypothetical protein